MPASMSRIITKSPASNSSPYIREAICGPMSARRRHSSRVPPSLAAASAKMTTPPLGLPYRRSPPDTHADMASPAVPIWPGPKGLDAPVMAADSGFFHCSWTGGGPQG